MIPVSICATCGLPEISDGSSWFTGAWYWVVLVIISPLESDPLEVGSTKMAGLASACMDPTISTRLTLVKDD